MKIRIGLTVDIDPDVWALEFGVARADVRMDVQRYVESSIRASLDTYRPDAPYAPERMTHNAPNRP